MVHATEDTSEAGRRMANSSQHEQGWVGSLASTIAYAPIRVLFAVVSKGIDILRPFAPQIVPIFVCLLLVPLVIFLSVYAGWIVWRSAPAAWQVPLLLQYGDGSQPYAKATIAGIAARQPYDISLRLSVPATESNFALGNFMASLELSTTSNKSIISVRRSAIVLPSSTRTLFIFSSQRKIIDLDIPVLDSFPLGASNVSAHVEIGRRDLWKTIGNGEGRELSVFSAILKGNVRHHGIRGLISRFPFISAIASSVIFLIVCLLVVGVCILPLVLSNEAEYAHSPPPEVPLEGPQKFDIDSSSGGDEKPHKPRRRARKSSLRRRALKAEDDTILIPSSSEQSPRPLRKRRSRGGGELSGSDE